MLEVQKKIVVNSVAMNCKRSCLWPPDGEPKCMQDKNSDHSQQQRVITDH